MTWVIVGASAGVGRALAEELAAPNTRLLLVSRDAEDLEALASHLRLAREAAVSLLSADADDPGALARGICAALPESERIEGVLLPVGAVNEDDDPLSTPERAERLVRVNYLSPASVASALLPRLLSGGGVVVGFGSVADVRGRQRNVTYAAAKRALRSHFESLRCAYGGRGVRVQFWVLGYHDTGLAWGRKLPLPKADPASTARRVVRAIRRGRSGVFFAPRIWRVVTLLLRFLPLAVFRRLGG